MLLWLLVVTSDLTLDQLARAFDALTLGHVAAFLGITVALLGLSALKWRLVMDELPASDAPAPSRTDAFLYTCLGATLSLFLMPHVAKHTGRALGAKFHGRQPAGKTVAASLFEQGFDLVMVVALAAFGAVLLAPALAPFIALVMVIVLIITLYVLRRPHLIPDRFHIADLSRILRRPLALRLSTISLVMYLLTAIRASFVAIPAGIALFPTEFFASFSLVQLSRFIAVTPMGLGVGDWTWATVLALLNLPLALAATFVLLNRSLNVVTTLAAFALSIVLSMVFRRA